MKFQSDSVDQKSEIIKVDWDNRPSQRFRTTLYTRQSSTEQINEYLYRWQHIEEAKSPTKESEVISGDMTFLLSPIDPNTCDNAIEYQVKVFASVDFMIGEAKKVREEATKATDNSVCYRNSMSSEMEPRVKLQFKHL
jgi:hypothetical protein